ncbi:hypothetical protein PIB30_051358 [Stylosanthes scabra]|uniref:Uncharacterized protein n=1 Tax=Stylosanthes scabra TaxID=79078 RepID=A0ABU6YFA7_9FABA|nr:hypothetical protein [Stylosanthes scabra]
MPPKKLPIQNMACEGTSKAAARSFSLGQGKGQGLWTSPSLVALRSQLAANPQPETPVTPTITPKEQEVIALSSDSKLEHKITGKEEDVEEDSEEGPDEAHQDTGMEKEHEKEDLEEDPEEENAAKEGVREVDDFADYWSLVRSDSEDSVGNDYRF